MAVEGCGRSRKQPGTPVSRLKEPSGPREQGEETGEAKGAARSRRGLPATLRILDFLPTSVGDLHIPPEEPPQSVADPALLWAGTSSDDPFQTDSKFFNHVVALLHNKGLLYNFKCVFHSPPIWLLTLAKRKCPVWQTLPHKVSSLTSDLHHFLPPLPALHLLPATYSHFVA